MAGWKGHLAGGVAVCGAYILTAQALPGDFTQNSSVLLSNWQFVAGLFVISMLMSLFPDIDTNSKGQDIFFTVAFSANILLILSGKFEVAAYLGLLAMTPIIGKHRGWTHSRIAMFLVPLPILIIPYLARSETLPVALMVYGSAVSGYFSHLLLDGLITKKIRFKT